VRSVKPPATFEDLSAADLARTHLRTLAAEPLFAPFVRRVLTPLVESGGALRWQAQSFEWGTVLRLLTIAFHLDFVFWTAEIRFSFFTHMREDLDGYLTSTEQAEEAAMWLREFLSHPFEAEGSVRPALLDPADRQ